jgi:hypothetical protein
MVNNSINIIKTKESLNSDGKITSSHLSVHHNSLIAQRTTTYDVRDPDPGFGQADKCGGPKPINGIPTSLLITGSPKAMHIYKQTKKKTLHRFASTQKNHILSTRHSEVILSLLATSGSTTMNTPINYLVFNFIKLYIIL